MNQVPLSGRVIFSDWHGVLSRDPFWTSIRLSATHPLHEQLEAGMAGVFDPARNIANEWMKGLLSSDQVIAEMGIQLRGRFRDDFLARRLDLDCARMQVNVDLFEVLRVIRAEAMVVIATDNMDCFARAFDHARSRRPPPRPRTGDAGGLGRHLRRHHLLQPGRSAEKRRPPDVLRAVARRPRGRLHRRRAHR